MSCSINHFCSSKHIWILEYLLQIFHFLDLKSKHQEICPKSKQLAIVERGLDFGSFDFDLLLIYVNISSQYYIENTFTSMI